MFSLSKRAFLKLAGLSIAPRIVPRSLLGAELVKGRESGRKVIIVTFGGGVRYSETFAPEGLRNIPRLAETAPERILLPKLRQLGRAFTFQFQCEHRHGKLAAR